MATESSSAIRAYNAVLESLKEQPNNTPQKVETSNDFSKMVQSFAEDAVNIGKNSEVQSAAAAAGKADLNSVVIAVSEAELTLNTVVAVRDKVLEAYKEILRMPI